MRLYGMEYIGGIVLDKTDDGTEEGSYLVVQVEGLDSPLIVPADRVEESE